jgi:ketosteroid isomerase-like protein
MSEENVEMVRRVYENATAHMEIPQELFDPNWELDVTEFSTEYARVLRGFRATRQALREHWGTFEDFQVEIEEVIQADEEQVVTVVRDSGRTRGSDTEISNRFFHVWIFRHGKIIHLSVHTDKSRALEAAGLSE